MISDPTDEIRAIRQKLAAACGNDLHRIAEETRRRQRESGREFVTLPGRSPSACEPDPELAAAKYGGPTDE